MLNDNRPHAARRAAALMYPLAPEAKEVPTPRSTVQWIRDAARAVARRFGQPADPEAIRPDRHPGAPDQPDYAAWVERHALTPERLAEGEARLAALTHRPLFSILMPVHDPEVSHLRLALGSAEAQLYPHWELCIVDDASARSEIRHLLKRYAQRTPRIRHLRLDEGRRIAGATNAALSMASGEFVVFLDHDDELTPDALLAVAEALSEDPSTDIVYSDHDILGADGFRRSPSFKPGWCPELLLSYMYFGHLKAYRTSLVREAGGLREGFEGSADYELALRLVERTERIRHVPRVLYHWRAAPGSMAEASSNKPLSFEAGRRAVQEALDRRGIEGRALWPDFAERSHLGLYHVSFRSTEDVPVTIVIPTRDKLPLLSACIDSIEQRTRHGAYRILIVDNDSREDETREYFSRTRHTVIPAPTEGGFNFSALMNRGVAAVETEFLVLLNNDTVVVSPAWLDELLGYGRLSGVGAVGAKLLYPDGRIQHAGVVLGIHGLTGHAFQPHLDNPDALEYHGYAHVARNYLAVTAACLLTRKSVFEKAGGFDERHLKVAWNDVDYCLRLREQGLRIVFNPNAVLLHLEAQSRGDHKDESEIAFMLHHWRRYVQDDPYYSPHLSRRDAMFRVKADPGEDQGLYYHRYW